MASETLYINRPGGVLVHLEDGTVQHVHYGDPVPANAKSSPAEMTSFATTSPPKAEADARAEVAAAAQERAALAEAGQVGSSSSPVPGNYPELSEEAAARFMQTLAQYPAQQAAVVEYERLNANRRQVIDAATDEACSIATDRIAALTGATPTTETVAAAGLSAEDLDQLKSSLREEIADELRKELTTASEVAVIDPEDYTETQLREIAAESGVDVGSKDTKAVIAEKLNAHYVAQAQQAGSGPTPSGSPDDAS